MRLHASAALAFLILTVCAVGEACNPTKEFMRLLMCLQELCPTLEDGTTIVINLSGRGDKDMYTAAKLLGWDV